jgi:ABC-type nitrate/sulfonate/bicarbonate transport system ATPase subunit
MTIQLEEVLLSLQGISLNFGTKKVLRDINLEVRNIVAQEACLGQVTTLLGKSGVGKTQLMKIIAGLLKPTTGEILIDGKPIIPGLVGMVLQNYPLFQHRTLLDNLTLVCKDKDKIDNYLSEFEMIEHKSKYPSQLSGGQRQRAAIIQQLLSSEHFILLDEPFSGLDPVAIDKLCLNINKVANQDEKNTVIISSHILEPSIAISDSIWILGNEKDSSDIKIEGATLLKNKNLVEEGLAWNPDIRKEAKFSHMMEEIRWLFKSI